MYRKGGGGGKGERLARFICGDGQGGDQRAEGERTASSMTQVKSSTGDEEHNQVKDGQR